MANRRLPGSDTFIPHCLDDIFAVYLSRELRDTERVRFYARLTKQHSMCLLINALRSARTRKRSDLVEPPEFVAALDQLTVEEPHA